MADLDDLRRLIDEPTQDFYTDAVLLDRISASDSLTQLAGTIWLEKAARYARLVDMQEGTSRRSLSQLQEQALTMSTRFLGDANGAGSSSVKRATTRPIERV